jgi:CheY-like chemotaxis protein
MLAADGHHVWEAQSGPEALAVLERESVDLVCTDLGMPGMTGWQVAERIRAAWPAVKVALVTGWAATVEPAEVETHQVDFLLGKPFRRKEVRAIVSAVRPPEG